MRLRRNLPTLKICDFQNWVRIPNEAIGELVLQWRVQVYSSLMNFPYYHFTTKVVLFSIRILSECGLFYFVVSADGGLCRERLLIGAGSVIGCSAKRQQEIPSGLDVLALLRLLHHTPERLVSSVPWNKYPLLFST